MHSTYSIHKKTFLYFAQIFYTEVRIIKNFKIIGERLKFIKLKLSRPLSDPAIINDNEFYFGHYQYCSPEQ